MFNFDYQHAFISVKNISYCKSLKVMFGALQLCFHKVAYHLTQICDGLCTNLCANVCFFFFFFAFPQCKSCSLNFQLPYYFHLTRNDTNILSILQRIFKKKLKQSILFSPRLLFSITSTPNCIMLPEQISRAGLSSPPLHSLWLSTKVPLLLFVSCK